MSATKIGSNSFMFKDIIPDDTVTTAPPSPAGKPNNNQSEYVNDARQRMVERHRNAWKKGHNNDQS